jgi:single-strand DNA-binding protein
MARSLNKVQLIGNLTRDPELRYTPNGTAVCSFGLATNRSWKTDAGERHDEAEFHNIVAWNKLAELCSQFLVKGRKVYVEGRLATRTWTGQDGAQRNRTEIVISDMILLDSNRPASGVAAVPAEQSVEEASREAKEPKETKKPSFAKASASAKGSGEPTEEVVPDDIPF